MALVDMIIVDEEQRKDTEEPAITTKLFVWGANDKRQLGMSTDPLSPLTGNEDSTSTGNIDGISSGGLGSASILSNLDLKVPHQIDPDPFVKNDDQTHLPHSICAGYYYSGAITQNGVVYTWGNGEFGRLGYIDVSR